MTAERVVFHLQLWLSNNAPNLPTNQPTIIINLFQDWSDVDEGWFFGEWESGPWHGYRTKEKAFGAYGWVRLSLILCN